MIWGRESQDNRDHPAVFEHGLVPRVNAKSRICAYVKFKPRVSSEDAPSQLQIGKDGEFVVPRGAELLSSDYSHDVRADMRKFSFDHDLDSLGDKIAKELFDGYNASVVSYGLAGTGKTYALFGTSELVNSKPPKIGGLVNDISSRIFDRIRSAEGGHHFSITVACIEIALEKVHDLLIKDSTGRHRRDVLKLHHDAKSKTTELKNLTQRVIATKDELDTAIIEAMSAKEPHWKLKASKRSKSHFIAKVTLEQRLKDEATLISSDLFLVDLSGSNPLSKNLVQDGIISHDEFKKYNLEVTSLNTLIQKLSEGDSHRCNFEESQLTKLLQNTLVGNSKTFFLVTGSDSLLDDNGNINTLETGSQIARIFTHPIRSIEALHMKRKLDLFLEDFAVKEQNYLSLITSLKQEITVLKGSEHSSIGVEGEVDNMKIENIKLKEQLDTISQLFHKFTREDQASEDLNQEILSTLMTKCESVASLELNQDRQKRDFLRLQSQMEAQRAKLEVAETMNLRLLEHIDKQEKSINDLLTTNALMKTELEDHVKLSASRLDKMKTLEVTIKELSLRSPDNSPRKSSVSSTSYLGYIDESHEEDSFSTVRHVGVNTSGNNKFINASVNGAPNNVLTTTTTAPVPATKGLWGGGRKVSGASISSNAQELGNAARPLKMGFNLQTVKPSVQIEANSSSDS